MNDIWLTPDGSIHEMPRETTQEERILAATKIVEEAQKTGIKIRDDLVETDQLVPEMSLRDWLASQALSGLLARAWSPTSELTYTALAAHAYSAADAMLEARKK